MLQRLSVRHFRNLQQIELTFPRAVTVILGENGHGKTSLLESVYLLSDHEIVRSGSLKEVVQHGAAFAKVQAGVGDDQIEMRLLQDVPGRFKKSFLENGAERTSRKRTIPFYAVLFLPEEVRLFNGPPSRRRDWLDTICRKLYGGYHPQRLLYERLLKNRNALLSDYLERGTLQVEVLDILTAKMAAAAASVWVGREQLVQRILPYVRAFLQQIWGKDLKPELVYEAPWKYAIGEADHAAIQRWFEDALHRDRPRELRAGRTMMGPHLDDLLPRLAGHAVGGMASRGELRSLSLSLKFAEVALLESLTGQRPLLLLDDVMSELDQPHRRKIEELTKGCQTIFTTTDLMFFSAPFLAEAEVVTLAHGALVEAAA